MEITFINHASIVCEHNGVKIISDPWLYGSAFNDGWDLVCASPISAADLAGIQYIWFSHEHPDHFSPRVLQDVPAAARGNITVLYKRSADGKVLGFCKKLGFKTLELVDGVPVELGGGMRATCHHVPIIDSWLLLEADGKRVLNLNDAVLYSPRELRKLAKLAGNVDVLLTQFSYAAWRGNREDRAMRQKDARAKLDILTAQVRGLKPRAVIPFASMSFFCHEENAFTSDSANKPWEVLPTIDTAGSTPVLLYPGDRWQVGAPHSNASACDRYKADYATLDTRAPRRSNVVDLDKLRAAADAYRQRIQASNDRWVLTLLERAPGLPLLKPIDIHLWDLKQDVRFDFRSGLQAIERRTPGYDLRMGSDSLAFLFKHAFGIDTLTVNGRFYADPAGMKRLLFTFGVDLLNNNNIRLAPSFLRDVPTIRFLVRILVRKLLSLRAAESARATRSASV